MRLLISKVPIITFPLFLFRLRLQRKYRYAEEKMIPSAKKSEFHSQKKEMKDLISIWKLEDETKELSRKIKKFIKHNKERGRAGRKGFHDQIENSIRIWKSQRKEILKKLKELKENES